MKTLNKNILMYRSPRLPLTMLSLISMLFLANCTNGNNSSSSSSPSPSEVLDSSLNTYALATDPNVIVDVIDNTQTGGVTYVDPNGNALPTPPPPPPVETTPDPTPITPPIVVTPDPDPTTPPVVTPDPIPTAPPTVDVPTPPVVVTPDPTPVVPPTTGQPDNDTCHDVAQLRCNQNLEAHHSCGSEGLDNSTDTSDVNECLNPHILKTNLAWGIHHNDFTGFSTNKKYVMLAGDDDHQIPEISGEGKLVVIYTGKKGRGTIDLVSHFRGKIILCGFNIKSIKDVKGKLVLVSSEVEKIEKTEGRIVTAKPEKPRNNTIKAHIGCTDKGARTSEIYSIQKGNLNKKFQPLKASHTETLDDSNGSCKEPSAPLSTLTSQPVHIDSYSNMFNCNGTGYNKNCTLAHPQVNDYLNSDGTHEYKAYFDTFEKMSRTGFTAFTAPKERMIQVTRCVQPQTTIHISTTMDHCPAGWNFEAKVYMYKNLSHRSPIKVNFVCNEKLFANGANPQFDNLDSLNGSCMLISTMDLPVNENCSNLKELIRKSNQLMGGPLYSPAN